MNKPKIVIKPKLKPTIPKIRIIPKKKPINEHEHEHELNPTINDGGLTEWPNSSKQNDGIVLSFDVAIKTLAYCMIDKNLKIYKWGLENLVTHDIASKCCALMKSGKRKDKMCGSVASCFESGNIAKAYCGRHRPKNQSNLVNINNILLCNGTIKSGIRQGCKCGKPAKVYKDLANNSREGFCAVHAKTQQDCKKYQKVDTIDPFDLRVNLFRFLDSHPEFFKVDTVLIEHQPPHATEKMRSVAFALFDYFVLRGKVDKNTIKTIKMVDAGNKLTMYTGEPLQCHLKAPYDRNKWYSVQYCKWFLRGIKNTQLIDYLESHNKQDDLADAMLQGLWWTRFGCQGKKPGINHKHQKVIYLQQNTNKIKKIRAVKPRTNQLNKGKFTLSNIKYYIKNWKDCKLTQIKGLKSSIEYYFGSVDNFMKIMG